MSKTPQAKKYFESERPRRKKVTGAPERVKVELSLQTREHDRFGVYWGCNSETRELRCH